MLVHGSGLLAFAYRTRVHCMERSRHGGRHVAWHRVTVHNAARVSQPAGSRGGSHWPTSLAAHAARHSADTWHPLPQPTPDTFSPRPGLDAEQRRGTHVFFPSKSSAPTPVTDGLHPSPIDTPSTLENLPAVQVS